MITIKDIARLAGVSSSTVSKVLNNYPDVSENTKIKVKKIVDEYHFTPNTSAQNLSMKKKKNIALIMSNLNDINENDITPLRELNGVVSAATQRGYEVAFYPITSEMQKTKSYYSFCRENNILGAILCGIRTDDVYFKELTDSNVPCVLIDIYATGKNSSSISINNIEASIKAVQYLIDHNHQKIAIINGKLKSVVGIERYDGYRQALINNHIQINPEYAIEGQFNEEIAYQKGKKLIENHPEITAVFCASDVMCIGFYRAMRELGKKIPDDISVIGFDDLPISKYISPALTTIQQNFYQFGYESVELLTNLIHKKNKQGFHIFADYKLIERESVKKL